MAQIISKTYTNVPAYADGNLAAFQTIAAPGDPLVMVSTPFVMAYPSRVGFTDDSVGNTYTVTGVDWYGNAASEVVTANSGNGSVVFSQVNSIVSTGATTNAMGYAYDPCYMPPIRLDNINGLVDDGVYVQFQNVSGLINSNFSTYGTLAPDADFENPETAADISWGVYSSQQDITQDISSMYNCTYMMIGFHIYAPDVEQDISVRILQAGTSYR